MNDSSLLDRCRLFLYVFCNLFFQNWKVICDNIPYDIIVYLKILVNYVISHAIHQFPRSVGMRIAKFFCKHIRGFAKNLDILNYGIYIISSSIKSPKVFPLVYRLILSIA